MNKIQLKFYKYYGKWYFIDFIAYFIDFYMYKYWQFKILYILHIQSVSYKQLLKIKNV